MELTDLTLLELSRQLAEKTCSSAEATEAALARIRALEPKLAAFLRVTEEEARAQAKASDERRARGESLGPLDGVPLALKDILCTRGVETTCGSKILKGFVPAYDATPVAKLRAAGAVLLGKLNMDEFAMGSSNENSAFGPVHNPWDLTRTPGGSSGGSAAAVSSREAFGTLGTDTGGSIRQPAALCGVCGIKPTYGRVSRFGVVAYASSLDQVGPLARTSDDCAALLSAIAGHDARDSTSAPQAVPDWRAAADQGIAGLRLGLPREYFVEGTDPEVEAAVRAAAKELEKLGAKLVEVSLPHTKYAIAAYYLVATAEASSNLARFDGVRYGHRAQGAASLLEMYEKTRSEGFGAEVKARIMLGTYALSAGYYDAYYLKAQKVRTLIRDDFTRAFQSCDAILTPTSPTAAFRLGEKANDPLQMYLADIFTISCNLASLPGMSIPCGFTKSNLPIGLQVLGKAFDEATLFRVGHAYQGATDWHARKPAIA
ncbi:MAG TPA: Asp-tRNA(Asn)/Glu-tRNA(Gln) amidotransferase subunit GatA [Myxococcales bacterium]|jgi:aspartyl-tRNA(Asn)/glutamyl-tRNA(Gln) amidotransferase subunit A